MAIGSDANANGARATAIGAGATASRDDQLMLGTSSTDVTAAA